MRLVRAALPSHLELESGDDLTLPRRSEGGAERIDESETSGGQAGRRIHGLRLLRISGCRIVRLRAVEHIGELNADIEAGSFANRE